MIGKIPLGLDILSLVLLIGGLLGALLRVVTNKTQPLWSRASIVDVVTGGLVGLLFPAFYTFDAAWTVLQRGAAVALVSYVSADLVTNLKERIVPGFLAPPQNRRAEDQR